MLDSKNGSTESKARPKAVQVKVTSIVSADIGSVKLSARTRSSKYDPWIEKAKSLPPGKMLLISVDGDDGVDAITRRLRNRIAKHNKGVTEAGEGVKLGVRNVEGENKVAIVRKD